MAKLGYRADPAATRLARNQSFRFAFILPTGANSFMTNLTEQVRAHRRLARRPARLHRHPACRRVRSGRAGGRAGVAPVRPITASPTIALDHPRVRAAIDDLAARGVAVVTLVSDAPSSRRMHYVGIDNPAAGRTAATLMGRFLHGRKGAVGVIAGSLALRDHAERQFGFHQILSGEYPESRRAAGARRARRQRAHPRADRDLLARRPDLRRHLQRRRRQPRHRRGAGGVRPRPRHRLDRP